MRMFRTFMLALAAIAVSVGAAASPSAPKNDAEYLTLPAPQRTDTGNKIEVIEFFAYYCPHCYAFDPILSDWVKRQGGNVVFKRVHVERDESVAAQQRLFFTLEAMGLEEKYHRAVFDAMHKDQRLPLANDEQVFNFAEQAGINRAKFIETYRSFGVQAKINRAHELMRIYAVNLWPYIAIDGHYVTSPSHVQRNMEGRPTEEQLFNGALQVMDFLVAKAKAEKK